MPLQNVLLGECFLGTTVGKKRDKHPEKGWKRRMRLFWAGSWDVLLAETTREVKIGRPTKPRKAGTADDTNSERWTLTEKRALALMHQPGGLGRGCQTLERREQFDTNQLTMSALQTLIPKEAKTYAYPPLETFPEPFTAKEAAASLRRSPPMSGAGVTGTRSDHLKPILAPGYETSLEHYANLLTALLSASVPREIKNLMKRSKLLALRKKPRKVLGLLVWCIAHNATTPNAYEWDEVLPHGWIEHDSYLELLEGSGERRSDEQTRTFQTRYKKPEFMMGGKSGKLSLWWPKKHGRRLSQFMFAHRPTPVKPFSSHRCRPLPRRRSRATIFGDRCKHPLRRRRDHTRRR